MGDIGRSDRLLLGKVAQTRAATPAGRSCGPTHVDHAGTLTHTASTIRVKWLMTKMREPSGMFSSAAVQSPGPVNPELMKHLKRVLAGAKAVVEKSAAAQSEDAEASVSLAKDRELVALARTTPELKNRLSQIVERAKSESKQIAEDKKAQIEALAQLERDLASLSPE